ncbi:MAG: hypothetical protein AAF432_14085 [Planctomycetota bacterium]
MQSTMKSPGERSPALPQNSPTGGGSRGRNPQWRRVLAIGAVISLLVHLGILVYLSLNYWWVPAPAGPDGASSIEFTIMSDEALTDAGATFEELIPDSVAEFNDLETSDLTSDLSADASAAEVTIGNVGARPRLGGAGAGDGDSPSLGGGGAGATFFGVSSRGTRFAYIVDRSSSMERGRRITIAKEELVQSLRGLPDYAQFYVVFYSTEIVIPPIQRNGWLTARSSVVGRFARWLESVDADGGTTPEPAFVQLFSLPVKPDVIFFLTDGEIPGRTVPALRAMNNGSRKVIINTISFGDAASQELLKQIAVDSGGTWTHVEAGNL